MIPFEQKQTISVFLGEGKKGIKSLTYGLLICISCLLYSGLILLQIEGRRSVYIHGTYCQVIIELDAHFQRY